MHDSKISILGSHLARGWALVPLHDVSAGTCSCGGGIGEQHKAAGKHPRARAWQDESQLIRDKATLEVIHEAHPEWNWGVATGRPSGIWVLDWDVAHDPQIRAWLTEQNKARAEALGLRGWTITPPDGVPDLGTLVLGPTGGGGWHYVFELPPDFEPRGSQTRNRYGLPPGLDVRGYHGQIVVAPSVSGKGTYGGVLLDRPVGRAPPWLEDTLRPAPEPERPVRPVSELALVPGGTMTPGLAASGEQLRALTYARSAVEGLLHEMATARDGERDDTSIRTALRLVELANAPWSGYSLDALYDAWVQARMSVADTPWVERDLPAKWNRAVSMVGGRPADLPTSYAGADHIPLLDFAAPPPGPSSPAATVAPEDLSALDPAGATASASPHGPGGQQDGQPLPVGAQGPMAGAPVLDPVEVMIGRMLTPEQLRALPPPQPLVNGVLDLNTCAWLIGPPGCCKSFVALDLSAHVGLGESWRGRRTAQGLVVYIVAEGATGMRLRVDAFEREYGEMANVLFLPEPVPADERRLPDRGAWSVLVEACRRLRPVLVIVDTQARVTIGLKENDNSDTAYYAEQADRIKRATGATVLTVHHQGRQGEHARGGSALDGAMDTLLRVERTGMLVKLHMPKQKDQAQTEPLAMALKVSDGGVDQATGRDLSSLVVARGPAPADLQIMDPTVHVPSPRQARAITLYEVLLEHTREGDFGSPPGLTRAELSAIFKDKMSASADTKRQWLARAWSDLVERNLILKRAGEQRFKVAIVKDQTSDGVLTPWSGDYAAAMIPEGWQPYRGDDGDIKKPDKSASE